MANKTPRIYLAAAILVAVVVFYVFSHWNPGGNLRGRIANVSRFDVPFARFRGAETLRNARSDELVAEVNEVIEQDGLPADVFVDDAMTAGNKKKPLPNIAETLDDEFRQYYDPENPDQSLDKLWDASPDGDDGEWNIDARTLEGVRPTLDKLEPKRQAIRAALKQRDPLFRFYYIFFAPNLGSLFDVEIKVNTNASRYLHDYALLEEYAIAQALLDGNIDEALISLAYIFRLTYLATHLGSVGTRSDAAVVRLRAFYIMQQVILNPKFDRPRMIVLRKMLTEQHEDWISEHVTWFGDRASGIILYHRLMLYLPVDVLEDAEFSELKKRGLINEIRPDEFEPGKFDKGFEKYHEADQAFYLRSMQKILDVCEEPYVKRIDTLEQINEELRRTVETRDEEGIAMEYFIANILLKDVNRLMQIFARDQSALNRALVLMDASLGQNTADRYHNPFTDKPYTIDKADDWLSITVPEFQYPFQVPAFTERK